MRRFTNILVVPLTADRQIPAETNAAVELAVANDAALTVFGVIPQPSRSQRLLHIGDRGQTMVDLLTVGVTAKLSAWADSVDHSRVSVVVGDGRVPIEIVRQVQGSSHDLVIMTTDGSDDSESVVQRVLRKCPCPVWVVRSESTDGPVLAAVDPDDDPGLNVLILGLAHSQAAQRNVKLHVVHAWQFYGESAMLHGEFAGLGAQSIGDFHDQVGFAHHEALDALLDFVDLEPPSPTVHLVEKNTVRAIQELVDGVGADLLVMGSVGRGALEGALMGNTAERVLHSTECSVVVVKPPGFVSPVNAA